MNTSPHILIVEDEPALASALDAVCRRLGAEPTVCFSGQRALTELGRQSWPVVILDIGLPDMNGLDLLHSCADSRVLVITAHGNLENAILAKQRGAAGYLVKPLDLTELQSTLDHLLHTPDRTTSKQIPNAKSTLAAVAGDDTGLLIGAAPAMQRVFIEIAHASASDAPVLLTGPTGTGKTHVARIVHNHSARRAAPFITLHCSALPEPLLESELFGHEKHAFTGATEKRTGHIERANGGTLLLDEIADITQPVQAKLLRFVEDKTFVRVGGREDHRVDLRLIVATNKDLREEVRQGRFREDLYYRLRVLEIALPPLAQRADDIPALISYFLGRLAPGRVVQPSDDTLRLLRQYSWPGNVRELRNAIEHALAVTNGPLIRPQHLPAIIRQHPATHDAIATRLQSVLSAWLRGRVADGATYDEITGQLESFVLRELLTQFDNKPTVMAHTLDMNRATLLKKRRQHHLDSEDSG